MNTDHHVTYFTELWQQSYDDFPRFDTVYSAAQQKENEGCFTAYRDRFNRVREEVRHGRPKPDSDRFFRSFRQFMQGVYHYSDEALAILLHPDLIAASRSFFEQARVFDPTLKSEEIYQAMRNVWIANGLQLLLGMRAEVTPAILAYSLLYPYSDNILDDAAIAHQDKLLFSNRFESRLKAEGDMSEHPREAKISALVGMIEEQFTRPDFPKVYASLLAIHNAQTRSLALSRTNQNLTWEEIVSIGFDKGGTSVVADGFLTAGRLSPEMEKFFFGYGIWLQLADDIQDIAEDIATGTQTLFSATDDILERTCLINRTIHFGRAIMNDITYCPAEIRVPFSRVIIQSTELMMVQSLAMNDEYFYPDYCVKMEQFSPISFQYLKQAKKEASPGRMKAVMQWMEGNQS